MNMLRKGTLLWVLIGLGVAGCSGEEQKSAPTVTELPDHIQKLENVTLFSFEEQLPKSDTVEMIRETVFESNEEVFMTGYTGEVAVDDKNRVYVVSSIPGTVHVYVFEPDGTFITKFMSEGRGPGEAESLGSMRIKNDKVYLFGPRLQKYLIYSADDFSFVRDEVIKRDSITDRAFSTMRAKDLFVDNEGQLLLNFQNFSLSDSLRKKYFYRISDDGQIKPELLFSQDKLYMHTHKMGMQNGPPIDFPMAMPFTRSSLFAISDNIYDIWTEDFLIKIFNLQGEYQRSIYYPYEKAAFDLATTPMPDDKRETAENDKIPAKWPAIHNFLVDDKGQLWVATITESDSTFTWYVLEESGALKAKFTFPGERADRSPRLASQLPIVKNGYFYSRERNLSEGTDQIVKYRIKFKEKKANQ